MRRTNRTQLSVHALEGREVPACVVAHPAPDTITIVGDNANDTVILRDNGAGVITGFATGAGAFAFAGIKNIRVVTGGGDDRVSYTLFSNLLPGQQRTVSADLGASTPLGSDYFVANLYNPATLVGSDLLVGSALTFNVFGGDGRDVIFVNAFRDTDVAGGAKLSMNLFGQSGNDTIAVHWWGFNGGEVSLTADGGTGNDQVRGRLHEDPGSNGKLSGVVKGGDGNDSLSLVMLTAKPPVIALLDGGNGVDVGFATPNVTVVNVP